MAALDPRDRALANPGSPSQVGLPPTAPHSNQPDGRAKPLIAHHASVASGPRLALSRHSTATYSSLDYWDRSLADSGLPRPDPTHDRAEVGTESGPTSPFMAAWPISPTCSIRAASPRAIHTPAPLLHTDPAPRPRTERTCPRPVHARIATSSGRPHARTTTSCGLALTRAPSSRIVDGRSRTTSAPLQDARRAPKSSARDTRNTPVEW